MFETQASSDYQLAMTILDIWALYRIPIMITFAVALALALIFLLLKHSAGKWFLFLALFLGILFVALDGFKMYVQKRKNAAIAEAITSPITNVVDRTFKTLFGVGQ